MGEIVNLRRARKARDRKAAEQAAAEARARHERTGGQRKAEQAEQDRLARAVDQRRRETPARDGHNGSSHSPEETEPS